MPGLLEGVKVIDLTHYFSGPYCTKLLATLGAEVIKIERPGSGDPIRQLPPFANQRLTGESGAWFLYLNTSKKSLTLDLKSEKGRELVLELTRSADILVENFAPGGMQRLGLDYDTLSQVNPALVMTSISNYGQTGPYRDWKAAEINLYATGGLMNITGEPAEPPPQRGRAVGPVGRRPERLCRHHDRPAPRRGHRRGAAH